MRTVNTTLKVTAAIIVNIALDVTVNVTVTMILIFSVTVTMMKAASVTVKATIFFCLSVNCFQLCFGGLVMMAAKLRIWLVEIWMGWCFERDHGLGMD